MNGTFPACLTNTPISAKQNEDAMRYAIPLLVVLFCSVINS